MEAKDINTLSDAEDRERIERTCHELYDKWREPEEWEAFRNGAEYENKYQREQQAELTNKVIELEKEIKRLKEYDHFKLP